MKDISTRDMILIAMFAAIIAILGYVSVVVPISPVPITGQTLGIMIIGLLLNKKQAAYSVLIWILVGIAGAPVFSGGRGGLSVLFSPTGGYIVGFLVGAYAISALKGESISLVRMSLSVVFGGIFVIYMFGIPWLAYTTGMDIYTAFTKGAFPFLVGDLIKSFIAVNLGYALRMRLKFLIS